MMILLSILLTILLTVVFGWIINYQLKMTGLAQIIANTALGCLALGAILLQTGVLGERHLILDF